MSHVPRGGEPIPARRVDRAVLRRWLPRIDEAHGPARLFCLHHAGGGASAFRGWRERVPSWLDPQPVQLPGRESRLLERPFTEMRGLVRELADVVEASAVRGYALLGHSMGALVALELARELSRRGSPPPARLFASAALPTTYSARSDRSDEDLVRHLRALGGTSDAMLRLRAGLGVVLSTLRADLAVCDSFDVAAARVACPITVFGGREDPIVSTERLGLWHDQTTAGCRISTFPGDHFFVRTEVEAVVQEVVGELRELSAAA